jgi:hypothetical protein
MSKRLVFAAVATAAIGALASSAAATTEYPVKVTRDDNGVTVTSHYGNQPLLGARVGYDGSVCWGFSYQVGHCASDFIPPISTGR